MPAPRSLGVCQVLRLAAAVNAAGPKPSSPESKPSEPVPASASGKAIPAAPLQGCRHAVIVWKIERPASSLTKVRGWPAGTTAGSPLAPGIDRSPCLNRKSRIETVEASGPSGSFAALRSEPGSPPWWSFSGRWPWVIRPRTATLRSNGSAPPAGDVVMATGMMAIDSYHDARRES